MQGTRKKLARLSASIGVGLILSVMVGVSPAGAQPAPPLDGNPISPGLGPTYGEEWCAPAG